METPTVQEDDGAPVYDGKPKPGLHSVARA